MESIIFSLDGRIELLEEVRKQCIIKDMDIPFGDINNQIFSDGEISVDYKTSVRGKRVYLLTSPSSSDYIMQLNIAIDAAKRAAAKEIIPILPYFPYARQDKKDQARGAIGAKVIAEMLENRGATHVITFDLHADQIQGFFNIPVTHMEGKFLFDRWVAHLYNEEHGDSLVLCSPDAGGTKRVKSVRDRVRDKYDIDLPIIMIDKTRKKANEIDDMVVIGEVKSKYIVIIDDMCDTAGTLCKAANTLVEMGALGVTAIVTHGIFSGPALGRIGESKIEKVVTSDSLQLRKPNPYDGGDCIGYDKVEVVTTANQIVNAMKAINENVSVEDLKRI